MVDVYLLRSRYGHRSVKYFEIAAKLKETYLSIIVSQYWFGYIFFQFLCDFKIFRWPVGIFRKFECLCFVLLHTSRLFIWYNSSLSICTNTMIQDPTLVLFRWPSQNIYMVHLVFMHYNYRLIIVCLKAPITSPLAISFIFVVGHWIFFILSPLINICFYMSRKSRNNSFFFLKKS